MYLLPKADGKVYGMTATLPSDQWKITDRRKVLKSMALRRKPCVVYPGSGNAGRSLTHAYPIGACDVHWQDVDPEAFALAREIGLTAHR